MDGKSQVQNHNKFYNQFNFILYYVLQVIVHLCSYIRGLHMSIIIYNIMFQAKAFVFSIVCIWLEISAVLYCVFPAKTRKKEKKLRGLGWVWDSPLTTKANQLVKENSCHSSSFITHKQFLVTMKPRNAAYYAMALSLVAIIYRIEIHNYYFYYF